MVIIKEKAKQDEAIKVLPITQNKVNLALDVLVNLPGGRADHPDVFKNAITEVLAAVQLWAQAQQKDKLVRSDIEFLGMLADANKIIGRAVLEIQRL